jgi:hypothetical protein
MMSPAKAAANRAEDARITKLILERNLIPAHLVDFFESAVDEDKHTEEEIRLKMTANHDWSLIKGML